LFAGQEYVGEEAGAAGPVDALLDEVDEELLAVPVDDETLVDVEDGVIAETELRLELMEELELVLKLELELELELVLKLELELREELVEDTIAVAVAVIARIAPVIVGTFWNAMFGTLNLR
jgi:hypothetical protein